MSARFWLFSLSCAGAALVGGFGLGLYATTPQKLPWAETILPEAPIQHDPYALDPAELTGPAEIDCKGCGPTLADRRMAMDMAGWQGMNDPVVRDYAAQDDSFQADHGPPPEPPVVQRLPAAIERFAAGEAGEPWQRVKVAQIPVPADDSNTPAEKVPADAAMSF